METLSLYLKVKALNNNLDTIFSTTFEGTTANNTDIKAWYTAHATDLTHLINLHEFIGKITSEKNKIENLGTICG